MLRVFLFGPLRLEWNGQPYKLAGLPKIASLLAYLLLHRAHLLEREQVAFTLWADETEANARANLRRHLHALKRALPPQGAWILSDAETVQWNLEAPFWLDVAEFERQTTDDRQQTTENVVRRLSSAVNLYRGDLCENLYDDWLVPERERLREKYIAALERLIENFERAQDVRAALEYAQQLLRADALREETYRVWMRLLAQNGDRAGVVRAYNLCITTLERELDVEPSVETKQLYEKLVLQENVSTQTSTRARHNLPQPLTSIIGRAAELEEIRARLQNARLVTLTGTGGVGKTRLALQAAHARLAEFSSLARFFDLTAVSQAEQLESYVMHTLEIVETTNRARRTVLLETLREREMLLVLDNCEHIIDAAANLAHEILSHTTRIKILATSREPLHVLGENVLTIAPLSLPSANENALSAPSAQLLLARAHAAHSTFQVNAENADALARICRAVEGIPLALELAAARLNALSPKQLAARLETQIQILETSRRVAPERHQTLQATFDWSFEALAPPQQLLLARLAIFQAGFTLDAVEQVCGFAPLEKDAVLPLLSDLIDKSLVIVEAVNGVMHYRMLIVTREFARVQLREGLDATRQHFVEYYVAAVQAHASEFYTARQIEAYAWVHHEYGNIRAALELAWTAHESRALARLCSALWQYWWTRGQLTEGRMWLERALAQSERLLPHLRAELLNGAGRLAVLQEDLNAARPLLQEHLVVRRALDDAHGIGEALNSLGALYYRDENFSASYAAYQESLEIFRALHHTGLVARALANLGELDVLQGELERGLQRLEESHILFKEIGALRGESIVLINLGTAALRANDVPRARAAFRDSLELKRAIQDQDGIAWTLEGLALVAARENDLSRALQLLGAAAQQRARVGTATPPSFMPLLHQVPQTALVQMTAQEIDAQIELGRALPLAQAISLALDA